MKNADVSRWTRDGNLATTQWFRRPKTWPAIAAFLRERALSHPVHVFCGGVSTGEEAYSVAMLLEQLSIPGSVTAVDIDPELIDEARAARVTVDGLRQALHANVLSLAEMDRYIDVAPDKRMTVTRRVRERVTFEVADLGRVDIPDADLLMLRNMWRHLSPAAYERTLRGVNAQLDRGALLSVGGADLLDILTLTETELPRRLSAPLVGLGLFIHPRG